MVLDDQKIFIENLVSYSVQIAAGLLHLSLGVDGIPILHRDLGLRNILLNGDQIVKIADFGLSKHLYKYEAKNTIPPWEWVDMKYFDSGEFTQKSDIWSFGIVLWEMWSSGTKPYEDWDADQQEGFENLQTIFLH